MRAVELKAVDFHAIPSEDAILLQVYGHCHLTASASASFGLHSGAYIFSQMFRIIKKNTVYVVDFDSLKLLQPMLPPEIAAKESPSTPSVTLAADERHVDALIMSPEAAQEQNKPRWVSIFEFGTPCSPLDLSICFFLRRISEKAGFVDAKALKTEIERDFGELVHLKVDQYKCIGFGVFKDTHSLKSALGRQVGIGSFKFQFERRILGHFKAHPSL